MGRLVIAHHKSYHPYRADNIERVKRDEEEARLQEAKEEGRLRLADSEARIDLLRKRARIQDNGKGKLRAQGGEDLIPEAVRASVADQEGGAPPSPSSTNKLPSLTSNGHINLFADIEEHEDSLKRATTQTIKHKSRDKDESGDTDKGYALAPSEADRTPWYTKLKEAHPHLDDDRRVRDEYNKSRQDPLTEITTSLRSSSRPSQNRAERRKYSMDPPATNDPALSERLTRENAERARAAELRERRRREKAGSETPSTVAGGYTDQYNKQEVEDARRRREEGQEWRERVPPWLGRDSNDLDRDHRDHRRDRDWYRSRRR